MKKHLLLFLFILIAPFTFADTFFNTNSTGGDCVSINGTWNNDTLTCTLTQNLPFDLVNVQNFSHGFTLDANGFEISYPSMISRWLYVIESNDVTIKNLVTRRSGYNVVPIRSNNTIFENNSFYDCYFGIYTWAAHPGYNITIRNNYFDNMTYAAVRIDGYPGVEIYNNNFMGAQGAWGYINETADYNTTVYGNYYEEHNNTDADGDGIADNPYSRGFITDLTTYSQSYGWQTSEETSIYTQDDCYHNAVSFKGFGGLMPIIALTLMFGFIMAMVFVFASGNQETMMSQSQNAGSALPIIFIALGVIVLVIVVLAASSSMILSLACG